MKKQYQLLLLAVFAIVLYSCKKSSNNSPVTPTTKPKYLTRTINVSTSPIDGSISNFFTDYTYDAQKRLVKISSTNGVTNYAYDGSNNLYSIEYVSNGARIGYDTFNYDGERIISALQTNYRNNEVFDQIKWDYVYNTQGQVTETHHEVYYELYTYNSNNDVIKVFHHGSPDFTDSFEYDNKKNMFINSASKSVLYFDQDRYSSNNVVKSTRTSAEGVAYPLGTTTYVYDSDGYPIGATTSGGSKFTYVYSTLE